MRPAGRRRRRRRPVGPDPGNTGVGNLQSLSSPPVRFGLAVRFYKQSMTQREEAGWILEGWSWLGSVQRFR